MKIKKILSIKLIGLIFFISIFGIGLFIYKKNNKITATPERPNIILISVDTLRADHLETYGYKKNTSPNIDEFAKRSSIFENAFTPVPWTPASYASLFTGTYPLKHQTFATELDKEFPTMAEVLKENKYKTSGFISAKILSDNLHNLGRGFDLYDEVDDKDIKESPEDVYALEWLDDTTSNIQRARRTTNQATEWLEKNKESKFFLFLHYFDPHLYYDAPEPFSDKFSSELPKNSLEDIEIQKQAMIYRNLPNEDIEYLKAKYDEEIAYTDYYVGKLLEKVDNLSLDKNTIIILTADHGESFDHDYIGHGYRLYNSSIQIPLIVYDPLQKESKRINEVVSLVDILPTLISRLDIKKELDMDGIDLNPILNGKTTTRKTIFSMSLPAILPNHTEKFLKRLKYSGQLYAAITKDYRLIYNDNSGYKESYDTNNDSEENNNTYNQNNEVSTELFEKIILWLSHNQDIETENLKIKSEELYQTLKSLGYL